MALSEARRLEHPWPAETVAYRAPATESNANGLDKLADSDLLVLISRRDVRAFEVIYDRHIEAAWRVALTYSDDAPGAERAVEAAFLRLWRQPEPGVRASFAARLLSSVRREAFPGSLDLDGRGTVEAGATAAAGNTREPRTLYSLCR